MAKPRSRSNGLCSSLTTLTQARSNCDCLKSDYDMTNAVRVASELFYRLAGRQPQYSGNCVQVVRPCYPQHCGCRLGHGCSGCTCDLDFVVLPGACEIERVTINGKVVDPRDYALSGDKLVRLNRCKWPMCQNLDIFDASPTNQFELVDHPGTITSLTAVKRANGCFDLTFSSAFNLGSLPAGEIVEFIGEDGWKWIIPISSLTSVSSTVFSYCPDEVHTGVLADDLDAADGYMVRALQLKPLQPLNTVFSLENVTVKVRKFSQRSENLTGTFEVVYRTGCSIPFEVQEAVGRLACEIALASSGSDKCRLPSNLRSFKLDGDLISRDDQYRYITNCMTGLPEVDAVLKSINPHCLARRPRLLASPAVGRRNRRLR